jgi:hypothetical protein
MYDRKVTPVLYTITCIVVFVLYLYWINEVLLLPASESYNQRALLRPFDL